MTGWVASFSGKSSFSHAIVAVALFQGPGCHLAASGCAIFRVAISPVGAENVSSAVPVTSAAQKARHKPSGISWIVKRGMMEVSTKIPAIPVSRDDRMDILGEMHMCHGKWELCPGSLTADVPGRLTGSCTRMTWPTDSPAVAGQAGREGPPDAHG